MNAAEKEEFRPKCAVGTPCTWLERHLEAEPNSRTKGLHLVEVVSLKHSKTRVAGVAFRLTRNARPLMLNFCPWCGESIDCNEATKAAAEADAMLAALDEGKEARG